MAAGETSAIYDLDLYPSNGGPVYDFFQSQFSSLYASKVRGSAVPKDETQKSTDATSIKRFRP